MPAKSLLSNWSSMRSHSSFSTTRPSSPRALTRRPRGSKAAIGGSITVFPGPPRGLPTHDRGELCLAGHDVILGLARVHRVARTVGVSGAAPPVAFQRAARPSVSIVRDGLGGGDL